MRKTFICLFLLSSIINLSYAQWQPAGDKLKTKWAEEIDINNVLPEYPRPIMERSNWLNLNGLWDYAILPVGKAEPNTFDGKILVPFAVESSLSGVMKEVGKDNELWYKTTFTVPKNWGNKNILLHFGAVDWKTEVFLNDIKIGGHTGGYASFSFDITPFLTKGEQKLVVKVWDPTNDGYQAIGKQRSNPHGIWYTPVTGIWQTVWLEPVAEKHIAQVVTTPDIDKNLLNIKVATNKASSADLIEVILKDGSTIVAKAKAAATECFNIHLSEAKLWSPESPFLYDMEVKLYEKGKLVDNVKSYAAMRKISMKKDAEGIMRMQLNNKDYFHFGTLDQGWWPDGLYTAPSDEALLYDIKKTKDFGFNMIRKHVKVEPARWYTHCDREGILVWQDMPNSDNKKSPEWQRHNYFNGLELVRSSEAEADYHREWKEIMDNLMPNPSIVVWVPFNEAWGQFKTVEVTEWTKAYDPSRLVNSASGGNHYKTGDILDTHHYPDPKMTMYDADRVTVLGEYGGIGCPLQGHLWQTDKNWGYIQFKNKKDVTDEYVKYTDKLKTLIKRGFSGAVYTQTTDVEGEVNGLITYDRKEIKIDEARVRKANQEVCKSLD